MFNLLFKVLDPFPTCNTASRGLLVTMRHFDHRLFDVPDSSKNYYGTMSWTSHLFQWVYMIAVQTVIKNDVTTGSSWEQMIKYTNHFAHFVTLFYSLLLLKLLLIPTGIELQNRSVYIWTRFKTDQQWYTIRNFHEKARSWPSVFVKITVKSIGVERFCDIVILKSNSISKTPSKFH